MPGTIPQWITDIESDEKDYKKKRNDIFIFSLFIFIAYAIVVQLKFLNNLYVAILTVIILLILIVFLSKIQAQELNLPNLLAANLFNIGTELEAFDSTSPSYLKRNQQYLKNCQRILNDLFVEDSYFIEDYKKFLNNIDNIILRINYFYSINSKPTNHSISSDLKALAETIHNDYKNLKPVHTAYVEGILSNLQAIEPKPLNISFINKWLKSFITGWYNISYSYRAASTLLFIGIITFSSLSIGMIYVLGMENQLSYSNSIMGAIAIIAGSITQIDKIVPKEKIKFS
ncbi:MAG: hypothetical protein Q7J35_11225 [Candidatus Methanoperedens sp.]|nr:hypothetical protein [Candidatus Methanoperedens sp.]